MEEIVSNLSPKKCHVFTLVLESPFHTISFLSIFVFRWPEDKVPSTAWGGLLPPWSPFLPAGQRALTRGGVGGRRGGSAPRPDSSAE